MLENDFIFSYSRHDCHWWFLACLMYQFGIVLVRSLVQSPVVKLYLMAGLQIVKTAMIIIFQPTLFARTNKMGAFLEVSILTTIILSTGFASEDEVSTTDLQSMRDVLAMCIAFVIALGICFGVILATCWARSLTYEAGTALGRKTRIAVVARDAMLCLNLLKEKDFLARTCALCSADLRLLEKCANMLITEYLYHQPSNSRFGQRVHCETGLRAWNPDKISTWLLELGKQSELQTVLANNMASRKRMRDLANQLRGTPEWIHMTEKSWCSWLAGTRSSWSYTFDDFRTAVRNQGSFTTAELQEVFDTFDINMSSTISVAERNSILIGILPKETAWRQEISGTESLQEIVGVSLDCDDASDDPSLCGDKASCITTGTANSEIRSRLDEKREDIAVSKPMGTYQKPEKISKLSDWCSGEVPGESELIDL